MASSKDLYYKSKSGPHYWFSWSQRHKRALVLTPTANARLHHELSEPFIEREQKKVDENKSPRHVMKMNVLECLINLTKSITIILLVMS